MIRAVQNSLLSLIYPQECRVCSNGVDNTSDGVACGECWEKNRIFDGSEMFCFKCGALLGDNASVVAVRCLKCEDYHFDKAVAAGVYEGALAAAILELKNSPHVGSRIRSLIIKAVATYREIFEIDLIVPVPLSKERAIERGYNQADLIAKAIGSEIKKPADTASLIRQVNTRIHRVGMDQKARELTVKNAFEIARPKLIAGNKILLVDDVLTSGATASACAKTLKKNGALRVNVFTLARAVMR